MSDETTTTDKSNGNGSGGNGASKTPEQQGFQLLNPPLAVYQPSETDEPLRGYVLSRQMTDDRAFYVLQLTEPTQHAQGRDGRIEQLDTGEQIAVWENASILGLSALVPHFETVGNDGTLVAKQAYEVILEPFRKEGDGWLFLIHARHLSAPNIDPPVMRPPSFPIAELGAPSVEARA